MGKVFQTEHPFELPGGYVDDDGNVHKKGTMRLSTAADEILPLKDPRVQQNPAYLSIILLSRVITNLGSMETINPKVIEDLYTVDFSFLQDLYNRINENGSALIPAQCPRCQHNFELEVGAPEE